MNESKILGFGSPILDLLVRVDDAFLACHGAGEKGGMMTLSAAAQQQLIEAAPSGPAKKALGGSAFNTIAALTQLGMKTAFLGKVGADRSGTFYRDAYAAMGGDASSFRVDPAEPTATCLSLVTPDSERTLRTSLGAAATLTADEITAADFNSVTHLHAEGYMVALPGHVLAHTLRLAKEHGCTVSLDLSSFEVVRNFRAEITELLTRYVDIVFANEDEARELCAVSPAAPDAFTPENAAAQLAQLCSTGAVKLGRRGAYLRQGSEVCAVGALPVTAIDTTGAGDLWQAGFLYGSLNGLTLRQAGEMGAILGAEIVQILGGAIPAAQWIDIKKKFNRIKGK